MYLLFVIYFSFYFSSVEKQKKKRDQKEMKTKGTNEANVLM